MNDDLVFRLRSFATWCEMTADAEMADEAADRIAALEAEVERLSQRRYELLREVAELRQVNPA